MGVAVLVNELFVAVLPPGASSCENSSRRYFDEGNVANSCHFAHLAEVDPVGWLVVVVTDEDPVTRPCSRHEIVASSRITILGN